MGRSSDGFKQWLDTPSYVDIDVIARSLQRERGWLIAPFEFFQEIFGLREKRVLAHYPSDRVRRSS
jgi:hypothetical protein